MNLQDTKIKITMERNKFTKVVAEVEAEEEVEITKTNTHNNKISKRRILKIMHKAHTTNQDSLMNHIMRKELQKQDIYQKRNQKYKSSQLSKWRRKDLHKQLHKSRRISNQSRNNKVTTDSPFLQREIE
jgi:hypothetical protein